MATSSFAGRPRQPVPALPEGIAACLFDLDGVLAQTGGLHVTAWKQTFDAFLRERADGGEEAFRPFEIPDDYVAYVDGRLREDGVRSFLESRGIEVPAATVTEIATRKNRLVLELIEREGVDVFEGSIRFVEAVRAGGLRRAVVSASKNTQPVLAAAGVTDLFEVVVDGKLAEELGLAGKPSPDTFLLAAEKLGVEPAHAAVFEDALAGVEAGRAGSFGYVVGVDRGAGRDSLLGHGADVVVTDLAQLLAAR